jgi:hypothetical protein
LEYSPDIGEKWVTEVQLQNCLQIENCVSLILFVDDVFGFSLL